MEFIPVKKVWFNIFKSVNVFYPMYRVKKNNHIDILVDEEKSFDKIQYTFMIKKRNSLKNRNRGGTSSI